MECLLIIFICFNSKFKATCKNEDFDYRCIKTHFDEKSQKFGNISVTVFLFSHQSSLTYLLSSAIWRLLKINKQNKQTKNENKNKHQTRFKMVHSSSNNAKSSVYQSQVCFLHTTVLIWVSLIKVVNLINDCLRGDYCMHFAHRP